MSTSAWRTTEVAAIRAPTSLGDTAVPAQTQNSRSAPITTRVKVRVHTLCLVISCWVVTCFCEQGNFLYQLYTWKREWKVLSHWMIDQRVLTAKNEVVVLNWIPFLAWMFPVALFFLFPSSPRIKPVHMNSYLREPMIFNVPYPRYIF